MTTDLAKQGQEIRTRLFGADSVKTADAALEQFDAGFAKHLNEQLFGEVWNRPGLPTETRSLVTVAVLMALGRGQELRLHMNGALNLGISADQLKEIIVHVSHYSGVPTAIEGIRALMEVTADRG